MYDIRSTQLGNNGLALLTKALFESNNEINLVLDSNGITDLKVIPFPPKLVQLSLLDLSNNDLGCHSI